MLDKLSREVVIGAIFYCVGVIAADIVGRKVGTKLGNGIVAAVQRHNERAQAISAK